MVASDALRHRSRLEIPRAVSTNGNKTSEMLPEKHYGRRKRRQLLSIQIIILLLVSMVLTVIVVKRLACHNSSNKQGSSETEQEEETFNGVHLSDEMLESSKFLLPNHLVPGEVLPLHWKSDESVVDDCARLTALPPKLTTEIKTFCDTTGLTEIFWSLIREYNDESDEETSQVHSLKNAQGKWASTRPGGSRYRTSNFHWVDPIDEYGYEEALGVLRRGGFDTVLQAIGNEFHNDGLMIIGMGFLVVSHHKGSNGHMDEPGTGHQMFDFLFPLILPKHEEAQLFIGESRFKKAPLPYTDGLGFIIGGDTYHETGECDYRQTNGLRVAVSIYLADINNSNIHLIAGDTTALFPVPNNVGWYRAQKGRVFGGGNSLATDKGRRPFVPRDKDEENCPVLAADGKCDTDPWEVRPLCPKSCKIYIPDEEYSEVLANNIKSVS